VRQQHRHGDRHVIAPLTRFIPETLLGRFERVTEHDPTMATGDGNPEAGGMRFDVGAKLRALWTG
jgi:DNA helicase-2/ATP-dependent DNA helicase PcrA